MCRGFPDVQCGKEGKYLACHIGNGFDVTGHSLLCQDDQEGGNPPLSRNAVVSAKSLCSQLL